MEESLTFLSKIKNEFKCEEVDIRQYSPLTLAFLGDCVFDLIIRTVVVERANRATEKLHKIKSKIVKAESQALLVKAILDNLTEEEFAVYKRGRNAKSFTTAKNASVKDYRKATGFEALIGYLFLQNKEERILELVQYALEKTEMEI